MSFMYARVGTRRAPTRSRGLRLSIALAVAFTVVLATAAVASAQFGVSGYSLTQSTTQAGAHPNVTWKFNRTGTESEDLRDMRIDLPPGLLANPESANPKCTDAQLNSDTCPASSRVGSLSYKYRVASSFDTTVPGNMYMLEPAATDVATVGFVLRPPKVCILIFCAVTQKIIQKTSFKLQAFDDPYMTVSNQDAQRSVTTSLPLIFTTPSFTTDVTIKSVQITAQARAGTTTAGPYFMVNPTSCEPATSTLTATSYQDVTATAAVTITPTGCDQTPFAPTFDFQPSDKSGGSTSQVLFTMDVPSDPAPIQNAAPKSLDITFPRGSAPDFTKLAEWTVRPRCGQADLEANTCPSGSAVGLAQAQSDFLPPALNGGVFLTGEVGLKIDLAIRLVGPRSTALIIRLTLGIRVSPLGETEVYATFVGGPQMPYKKFLLALLPLYVNPQQCGPAVTTVKAVGWNDAEVTRTTSYDVTNCQPPQTTITSGPPAATTDTTPTFTFASSIPQSQFFCKLDTDPEFACDSGTFTTDALTPGQHTFSVAAQNGPARDQTPATSTFTVSPPGPPTSASFSVSTTQAAAHPDLTSEIDFGAGVAARSVRVLLPRGLQASSAAVPECTVAEAEAAACPASSRVGSVTIQVDTPSGPQTGNGDAYLTAAPTAEDAAGLAVEVPLVGGTFVAIGGQSTTDNTNRQVLNIRDIPAAVNGTAITVRQFDMQLSGANRFLTNASRCTASQFEVVAFADDGTPSTAIQLPYQATDCPAVPFAPTVEQSFPETPQASSTTGITVDVDLPIDHGTMSSLTVLEPPAFGPNFPAFGTAADKCPGGAASIGTLFDPTNCPPQSIIGTMTIDTPLLTTPLVGDVYLVNKVPLPWFGVKFSRPGIELRLTGVTSLPKVDPACDPAVTGFCQTQISTEFSDLPDSPLTHVEFDLTMPDRVVGSRVLSSDLLTVADPGEDCTPIGIGSWTAQSHSGASRSGTQDIPIDGC